MPHLQREDPKAPSGLRKTGCENLYIYHRHPFFNDSKTTEELASGLVSEYNTCTEVNNKTRLCLASYLGPKL